VSTAAFLAPEPLELPPGEKHANSGSIAKFRMEPQEMRKWCWAAVASSVANLFLSGSGKQCAIAIALLGSNPELAKCCKPIDKKKPCFGRPCVCNQRNSLEGALRHVKHYEDKCGGTICPPALFNTVIQEIGTAGQDQRPVCARILSHDDAHFVVITGWQTRPGRERVLVKDPFYSLSGIEMDYADLREGYLAGKWDETYFVAKSSSTSLLT
jgi:hypothetical protein